MSRLLCALGVFAITATTTLIVTAAPYVPKTADEIVAQWPALNDAAVQKIKSPLQNNNQGNTQAGDTAAVVALANVYLAQAALPGQSRLYGLAQAALKPAIEKSLTENNPIDKNLWLAWAQVQQHQHNFVVAQQALEKVLQQDPTDINANLLAARIYVIQENPLAARNACLKLLGSADLFTVTACSLEANTYLNPDDLGSSYQQLKQLINSQGLPSDERGTWLIQMLADMAMRNKDPSAAASWLEQRLQNASVNYLSQWADVQLALNNAAQVIQHLTQVLNNVPEMDDALLLRLALAEKKINATERLWQTQLTERVLLREQRQDNLHANEMTIYYLDINPNPAKALYWARINIVSAKEAHDKELLARAEKLNLMEASSFKKDHANE